MSIHKLELKAANLRKKIWELIYEHNTGHTGSDFSCVDILVALYYGTMNQNPKNFKERDTDTYIQSKGHAVEVLYEVLADRGYFPESDLKSFSTFNSPYIGHPTNHVNGIEVNTGSLGHGLGLGVGIALAAKMDKSSKRVFVLMGDGEQAEGSIWEAAMSAGNYKLDNLTAIIDHNNLQITGSTDDVMQSNPLASKYAAFGFEVTEIDGNDMTALVKVLNMPNTSTKPRLIIANTIKGKGISFMENVAKWHHGVPTQEQFKLGMKELNKKLEELNND